MRDIKKLIVVLPAVVFLLTLPMVVLAQESQPATSQPAVEQPAAPSEAPAKPAEEPKKEEVKAEEAPKVEEKAEEKKEEAVPAETKEETQQWWQNVLVLLIEAAVVIFGPIIALLLTLVLRKWKLNIELDTVDKIVSKATGFAEQKAKVALKDGKKLEAPEAAKLALGLAEDLSKRYSLPTKAKEKLTDLIEAKLGEKELEKKAAKPA